MPKFSKAFTLVELLIVVVIIGILSGITVQVLNVSGQRNRAQDSIRLANITKVVEGVEAFYAAEGYYPTTTTALASYIQLWPNAQPESFDTYTYASDGTSFGVTVDTEVIVNGYKYRSEWGEVRECENIDPATSLCQDLTGAPSCTSNAECLLSSDSCSPGTYGGCNASGECQCFSFASYPCESAGDCSALEACPGSGPYCNTSGSPTCYCTGGEI